MTLTDFLKLRKPDFTIPADIRDINFNMDILDAKAQELDNAIKGTGSSDGIMNMIRQITGEADWSDPPAVALNGKVTGKWTIYDRYTLEAAFNLTENETLEQIADLVPDYSIVVIQLANNSWMNLPPVNTQGIIWITKTNGENCYAQFWDRVADTQYFNNRNLQSGLFMGWQQIALAAPPVSYVPELSPNFTRGTGDMFYYRNSFGEINVSADVIKTGANIASGDLIMTLPAGFRPTRLYELPANYFNTSNGVNYAGFVRFTADGQITAQYGQIAGTVVAQQMSFQCVFLAGN